jgi:2-enoate reductase
VVKGKYSKLFEPISIGKVEMKNRIAMAPMAIGGLTTPDGGFGARAIDYYAERAKGGVGLIITGAALVDNKIEKHFPSSTLSAAHNLEHFVETGLELTKRIHAQGAKIFAQLTAGVGRVAAPIRGRSGAEYAPVAPSAIPNYWDPSVTCRELTIEEIKRLIKKCGDAAEAVKTAGFDGIDFHGLHEGYLVDQFAISMFNRRSDRYGGDLRQRLTLAVEILQEMKNRAGKEFPIQLRFSVKSYVKDWRQGGLPGEEFHEAARNMEEGLEVARIMEEAGYDSFDADAGTYDAWYWAHPPNYFEHGCYLHLTGELKKAVKIPVVVAGRMELPELAEQAIAEGKADMVVLGRGLLADPYWPNKVMSGNIKNIRPCLGCHQGCLGRMIAMEGPLSCAVNPACGNERELALKPARETKKIIVVGGGVAGMEAARAAAIRGHNVTLYEKGDRLGGHVRTASVPSFKMDEARLLDWYRTELEELKVRINVGKEASVESLKKEKPDAAIIATGSRPVIPDVPGIGRENVTTAIDVLLGKKKAGKRVVIVGGGLIGCETALWLAQQGKQVTIVEVLKSLMRSGSPVPRPNMMMLRDLLKFHEVNVLTNTCLSEITDEGVSVIVNSSEQTTLPVDTVVIACGLCPENQLYNTLKSSVPNLQLVGDAAEARNIMHAIWDGYEAARNI